MNGNLRQFFNAIRDLLFPPICLVCREFIDPPTDKIHLCGSCRQDLVVISEPICLRCGHYFSDSAGPSHLCGFCRKNNWHFDKARAILLFVGPAKDLIHDFKYRGRPWALSSFNGLARNLPHLQDISIPDIIIPVPLHKKRLRQRGFNQSAILAKSIFANYKKLIQYDWLIRQRWTKPQTGLSGLERRKNLQGSFSLDVKNKVRGKRILLIDDVFTTGSTVNECAKVLKKGGAKNVDVLTLARVKN